MLSRKLMMSFALVLLTASVVQAGQSLVISTESEYPPFSDEDMNQGGLFPAITLAVFDKLGYQVDINFMPFKRALLSTENLQSLALVGASKNKDREETFYYSDPIYTVRQSFFVAKNSPIKDLNEEQLKDLTVCRPLGNNLKFVQQYLDKGILKLAQPSTFKQCFEMLRLDRVQMVQVSYAVGKRLIDQIYGGASEIRVIEPALQSNSVHFVVSRKHPNATEWIDKINSSYRELSDSGEIQRLIQRFF